MTLIKKFRYEILFFVIFCLARTPYLGVEMFNTDIWKWKARIYDFGSGVFNLDFNKTLQKYHPGVPLMWLGTGAIKFEGLYCWVATCPDETIDPIGAVFALHFFQKLFVIVAIGLTLTFAFYPLRKLFGVKYAFITMSLLSFEPFFYALTRVIHLEGLMTSFMLASFVWLFYAFEVSREQKGPVGRTKIITSVVFAGLAILTKSSAIFILPFSILSIIFYQKKSFKGILKLSTMWVLGTIFTYFILWPSMWIQPLKTLEYVFVRGIKETGLEGEHAQIFLGQYTENPGIFYYPVVMALKFSPILLTGVILFAFLFTRILQRFGEGKAKRFALLAVIFTFGYLVELTIPTKKLDRYILPVLISTSLLAGFFYTWLLVVLLPKTKLDKVLHHLNWGKFCTIFVAGPCPSLWRGSPTPQMAQRLAPLALFVAILAYQSLSLTPNYFSYYNPLLGGLDKGIYALEPKWIIGQHQVAQYFVDLMKNEQLEPFYQGQSLNNQKDLSQKLIVAFPEKYYTQIWPFIRSIGAWATIEDLRDDARRSSYFVYPVWDDYSNKETRFRLTYKDGIYLRGVKLYNVYQRDDI